MAPKEDEKAELKLQKSIQDGVRKVHDVDKLQTIKESVDKAQTQKSGGDGDKKKDKG